VFTLTPDDVAEQNIVPSLVDEPVRGVLGILPGCRGGSLVISSCTEKYSVVDYRKSIMAYERVIPIEACRDYRLNHYGTALNVGDWESMPCPFIPTNVFA
jgi:hypothetical protein